MRVLGIDPGTGRLGWALVEGNRSKQTLLVCGCFETAVKEVAAKRLAEISYFVEELVDKYKPDEAAVEDLFFFKNAKTVIRVSESRGVVVAGIARAKIPVFDYTPLQVKQTVTGYGRAEKAQVQKMIKALLHLEAVPKPDDAADAVAVGVTHLLFNRKLLDQGNQ